MGPIKNFNCGKLRNYFAIWLRIVLKSIQTFDSHVKFFLIVVSFQAILASVKKLEIGSVKQAEELTKLLIIIYIIIYIIVINV